MVLDQDRSMDPIGDGDIDNFFDVQSKEREKSSSAEVEVIEVDDEKRATPSPVKHSLSAGPKVLKSCVELASDTESEGEGDGALREAEKDTGSLDSPLEQSPWVIDGDLLDNDAAVFADQTDTSILDSPANKQQLCSDLPGGRSLRLATDAVDDCPTSVCVSQEQLHRHASISSLSEEDEPELLIDEEEGEKKEEEEEAKEDDELHCADAAKCVDAKTITLDGDVSSGPAADERSSGARLEDKCKKKWERNWNQQNDDVSRLSAGPNTTVAGTASAVAIGSPPPKKIRWSQLIREQQRQKQQAEREKEKEEEDDLEEGAVEDGQWSVHALLDYDPWKDTFLVRWAPLERWPPSSSEWMTRKQLKECKHLFPFMDGKECVRKAIVAWGQWAMPTKHDGAKKWLTKHEINTLYNNELTDDDPVFALRELELSLNACVGARGEAPVYVFDLFYPAAPLPNFQYVFENVLTSAARAFLDGHDEEASPPPPRREGRRRVTRPQPYREIGWHAKEEREESVPSEREQARILDQLKNPRSIPLALCRDPTKEWTVRAGRAIPEDTVLFEYLGLVLAPGEHEDSHSCYIFDLNQPHSTHKMAIDARDYGNMSRFLSHACHPNCEVVKVPSAEYGLRLPHYVFIARKHIACGEEMTISYHPDGGTHNGGKCRCAVECPNGL